MSHKNVLGKDLKVGDVIEVWWKPKRDQIIALKPYNNKTMLKIWEKHEGDPRLADFAINRVGMTIEPQMIYKVYTLKLGEQL